MEGTTSRRWLVLKWVISLSLLFYVVRLIWPVSMAPCVTLTGGLSRCCDLRLHDSGVLPQWLADVFDDPGAGVALSIGQIFSSI